MEAFFTTKGAHAATGLGLFLALGFAEQAGGRLAIESEPGCGTTVTLVLPSAADAPLPD
jgi:signal transduction histidine kinase